MSAKLRRVATSLLIAAQALAAAALAQQTDEDRPRQSTLARAAASIARARRNLPCPGQ
jgi:hypothetical protein